MLIIELPKLITIRDRSESELQNGRASEVRSFGKFQTRTSGPEVSSERLLRNTVQMLSRESQAVMIF